MGRLRVAFGDVYMGFHETDYLFKHLFMNRYNAVEVNDNPDIVFFNHRKRRTPVFERTNAIKVFITGELQGKKHHPNDFSFSFDDTDDTNFYLPGFVRDKTWFDFLETPIDNIPKQKFCHFIYFNDKAKERIEFCKALMQYKRVDCPSRVLNNMPNFTRGGRQAQQWRQEKIDFIKRYKFAIAYENVPAPNYITEKMFHAYLVGNVPIYWGASNVTDFFNPNSFINARDFTSNSDLVKYIQKVDNDPELYEQYKQAPMLHNDSPLQQCTKTEIFKRFDKIVEAAKNR